MDVGSFPPNGFELHDVHGNVSEWVEDCWNRSYQGAPADGSAWASGDCSGRVVRGGSWSDLPWFLRSAYRGPRSPSGSLGRLGNLGFRVARTLQIPLQPKDILLQVGQERRRAWLDWP